MRAIARLHEDREFIPDPILRCRINSGNRHIVAQVDSGSKLSWDDNALRRICNYDHDVDRNRVAGLVCSACCMKMPVYIVDTRVQRRSGPRASRTTEPRPQPEVEHRNRIRRLK